MRPRILAVQLVLHNRGEGIGFQACAANQRSVDFLLTAEIWSIVVLDTAAIEDAHLRCHIASEQLGYFGTNDTVRIYCHFGCRDSPP